MASERNTLAGGPSNALVRRVRSVLWSYMRCKPQRNDRIWLETWQWAAAVARRNSLYDFRPKAKSRKWPMPTEIASQYVFLGLLEMRECRALRLPFHAAERVPPAIAARFAAMGGGVAGVLPEIEYTGSAPTTAGERPDLTA